MKRILLITPYYLTKKEVGGAFTYQFCERLGESCKIDVVLFKYDGDVIDKPENNNIEVVCAQKISRFDKYISWLQSPWYHPLFTSRYSWKMVCFLSEKIKDNGYDYIVFDYSQTFALANKINHPHKLLILHDVIYQRFEREGSKLIKWIKWSEGKLLKGVEKIYTFSDKDCQLINSIYGVESDVTPVFIKKDILNTMPTKSEDYHVFFADWSRRDNEESIEWFISKVAPHLRQVPFKIIGGGLSKVIKDTVDEYSNIEYLGFVNNPYPIIANAKSVICSLHTGAGIKVKCLEALACGTPVIGTEIAFEGIDKTFAKYLYLANSSEEYVNLITKTKNTVEEKKAIKESFIKGYSQKSVINYIIQEK